MKKPVESIPLACFKLSYQPLAQVSVLFMYLLCVQGIGELHLA